VGREESNEPKRGGRVCLSPLSFEKNGRPPRHFPRPYLFLLNMRACAHTHRHTNATHTHANVPAAAGFRGVLIARREKKKQRRGGNGWEGERARASEEEKGGGGGGGGGGHNPPHARPVFGAPRVGPPQRGARWGARRAWCLGSRAPSRPLSLPLSCTFFPLMPSTTHLTRVVITLGTPSHQSLQPPGGGRERRGGVPGEKRGAGSTHTHAHAHAHTSHKPPRQRELGSIT